MIVVCNGMVSREVPCLYGGVLQVLFPTSCWNTRDTALSLQIDSGDIAVGLSRSRVGSHRNSVSSPQAGVVLATQPSSGYQHTVHDPTMNDCVQYSGTMYQRCLHTFLGAMFLTYVPVAATVASVYPCGMYARSCWA